MKKPFTALLIALLLVNPNVGFSFGGAWDSGVVSLGSGTGDVVGPSSASDNALARFDGTTGELIDNSGVYLIDSGFLGLNDTTPENRLDVEDGSVSLATPETRNVVTSNGTYTGGDSATSVRAFYATPTYSGTADLSTLSGFYALTDDGRSTATTTHNFGVVGRARLSGAGANTYTTGVYGDYGVSAGTATNAGAFYAIGGNLVSGTGTVTNHFGLKVDKPTDTGSGVITNAYGVLVAAFDSSPDADNNNIGVSIGGPPTGPVNASLYISSGDAYIADNIIQSKSNFNTSSGNEIGITQTLSRNSGSSGTTGEHIGIQSTVTANDGSGTVAGLVGYDVIVSNGNAHTETVQSAIEIQNKTTNASSIVTDGYGLRVNNLSNTGTFTRYYANYVGDITAGTQTNTPFSFYASDTGAFNFFGGNTGFGSGNTAPQEAVDIVGAMNLTPQAGPPSSADSGDLYVDSTPTPDELCFYDGAGWQGISSGTDANCA